MDRDFFIILFQLRSYLVSLCDGLTFLSISILSIINQILIRSSQKLAQVLLNPLDLTSLLIKLETKLVSYPRLALHAWHSENIWYMYKFMKLQSFIISDTLYAVSHILLVDKSLQFHLFQIHNIPLFHLTLQKLFQYTIHEENFAIRSDRQYISFPLSTDIMACQSPNGQFCDINTPYIQWTHPSPAATSYSSTIEIK